MQAYQFFLLILSRLFCTFLFSFTVTVPEEIEMWPHDNSILHKLFHAVNQSIPVSTGHQSASSALAVLFGELLVSHRNRALVRYREHAHPATQDS
jgi:hypothetical protein